MIINVIKLCAKDPHEAKFLLLINKDKSADLKHLDSSEAFTECLNNMDDIRENTYKYNTNKKRKVLLVFDNQ